MERGRSTAGVRAAGIAAAGIAVTVAGIAAAATTTTGPGGAASQSSVARPDPSARAAMRACARVFGGSNVGSASRTTIGDVRRSGGGPPVVGGGVASMPAAHAFSDEPASAMAFWCWAGHPGDWTLYGVDTRGTRVEMYEEHDHAQPFLAPAPPDAPAFWF